MNAANPDPREKELFEQALEAPSAAERLAFLKGACGKDAALFARVQALLQAHEADDGFLPGQPSAGRTAVTVTEKPGDRIGHYKVREKIGEGGCGVVYVAEQEQPVRRKVALKIIKLGMDTRSVVARFEAERQALALMDHPNIAKVFDAGATEIGRPYFVMELVRGIRITQYCDQNHLSTRQRLDLFIQVCRAVQHAHQKGIIHRDLKPSNILVTLHDGVPVPKVIDFGIAKATEGRLTDLTVYTELNQFIGTPAYMSPEQAEMSGLDIDTRSDIYSLGVLLYELLTGKTPFDPKELLALGLDEIRRTIREKDPVRPSTRLSTMLQGELSTTAQQRQAEAPKLISLLRGDLDWIVMKALEKDRTRRYETANGLAADLKRFLADEAVVARPPSAAYRLQKAILRNKLAFAAAGAVAAALALGMVISAWQAFRATKQRGFAEQERKKAEAAQMAEKAQRLTAQQKQAEAEFQRQRAERETYVADLSLVQHAWEDNNSGRVQELLQETEDYPDRGFEWYYWQRQTHLELTCLRGHTDSVLAVAFSPDGQRIVTGSRDHTARIWDSRTGQELLVLTGHYGRIGAVAFSPDGQRIATASGDQTARIWDATSGKALVTLHGLDEISAVAFSPDGRQVLTAGGARIATIWDATLGKRLLTLEGHTQLIRAAAFSTDGQRIATAGMDRTARIWDAASGRELLCLRGHTYTVNSVGFSRDGQRLVTAGDDQTARVWDALTGRELGAITNRAGGIFSVAFSPDDRRIATAGSQVANIWDAATGNHLLIFRGHAAEVYCLAFSLDGQRIVTGSEDRIAKVWSAGHSQEPLALTGHKSEFGEMSVAFSPNSRQIVTGGLGIEAQIWDIASGKEIGALRGHAADIRPLFSPDGQRIISANLESTVCVWDARSRAELFNFKELRRTATAGYSPDGKWILTASGYSARIREASTGKELVTIYNPTGQIRCASFSPDARRVAIGAADNVVKLWDAIKGVQQSPVLEGHTAPIESVAFSPDGQRIVTGSEDKTARVWDAANGQQLFTLSGHTAPIESVAFSADGRRILTVSGDVRLWEATIGKEVLALKGNTAAVSPDAQKLAVGDYGDGTVKIFQAASREQVGTWREAEKAQAERLAAAQREQLAMAKHEREMGAHDPGAIKQWLVLAPLPFRNTDTNDDSAAIPALNEAQLPREAELHPVDGEKVDLGERQLVWKAIRRPDYRLDFNEAVGAMTEWSAGYAVTYIQSETDQKELLIKVGSDDNSKIFLNGEEIYRREQPRAYMPDEDVVGGVHLKAGMNVLIFKLLNARGDWEGSVRFTDSGGQPVKGIQMTLVQ